MAKYLLIKRNGEAYLAESKTLKAIMYGIWGGAIKPCAPAVDKTPEMDCWFHATEEIGGKWFKVADGGTLDDMEDDIEEEMALEMGQEHGGNAGLRWAMFEEREFNNDFYAVYNSLSEAKEGIDKAVEGQVWKEGTDAVVIGIDKDDIAHAAYVYTDGWERLGEIPSWYNGIR